MKRPRFNIFVIILAIYAVGATAGIVRRDRKIMECRWKIRRLSINIASYRHFISDLHQARRLDPENRQIP